VFSSYGVIPDDGTEFEVEIDRLHVKVTGIQDHRIVAMTVTLLPEPEEDEDEEKKSRKKSDEDEEDGKKKSRKSDEEDD